MEMEMEMEMESLKEWVTQSNNWNLVINTAAIMSNDFSIWNFKPIALFFLNLAKKLECKKVMLNFTTHVNQMIK